MEIKTNGTLCATIGHDYRVVRNEKAKYEQCCRCGKARFIRT